MRPEGIRTGRKTSWAALIALFLAPLLIVGALLGLAGGGDEKKVTAAIVNLDEGTEVEGQFVPMGRQLGAALIGREDDNIQWILADVEHGRDGLRSGEYSAVVTIPKDFSSRVMSFAANDPAVAEKADVQIEVSRNAPAFDGDIAQEIARIGMQEINTMLTQQYLGGIYEGFNEVGVQFQQIVDGARQLHDGASQLSDGVDKASDGTGQLADGMGQLSAGGRPLADGGRKLADGGRDLQTGAAQLADGVRQLDQGVQQMAGQLPQLSDGVARLASGANQLLPRVGQYTDGVGQLVGGVGQLSHGLNQVVEGLDKGKQDLARLPELADGARRIADGVEQFATPLGQLDGLITDETLANAQAVRNQLGDVAEFVQTSDDKMQGYADGSLPLPKEVQQMAEQIKADFTCTDTDPDACAEQRRKYEEGVDAALEQGFRGGAARGHELLHRTDPSTGKTYYDLAIEAGGRINKVLDQIVDGLHQAKEAIPQLKQLADGTRQVADGVEQLAHQMPKQMGELREGIAQLRDGAGQIVDKSQPLVTGGRQLADGADQLNSGIQQLASQLDALPAGVHQLADGTSRLADGAGQLSSGVGKYSNGVSEYTRGVGQYVDGVAKASDGADGLAEGMTQLGDGARKLSGGLGTFSDKLAEGKEQLPSYSKSDQDTLAGVVSSPINAKDGLMSRGTIALSAIILVAALWLAALAAFTFVRPVPSDVVLSQASNGRLWLRTVAVPTGVVWASGLVLGAICGWWWEMAVPRTLGMMAILGGLGVVFALTHHALSGWLGNVGRVISLVLLAVTVGLGLSSGLAGWLDVVASVSPAQSGMLLTRSYLAGASVVTSLGVMVFVAVVMATLSWMAIAMRRRLTPASFRLRHA